MLQLLMSMEERKTSSNFPLFALFDTLVFIPHNLRLVLLRWNDIAAEIRNKRTGFHSLREATAWRYARKQHVLLSRGMCSFCVQRQYHRLRKQNYLLCSFFPSTDSLRLKLQENPVRAFHPRDNNSDPLHSVWWLYKKVSFPFAQFHRTVHHSPFAIASFHLLFRISGCELCGSHSSLVQVKTIVKSLKKNCDNGKSERAHHVNNFEPYELQ